MMSDMSHHQILFQSLNFRLWQFTLFHCFNEIRQILQPVTQDIKLSANCNHKSRYRGVTDNGNERTSYQGDGFRYISNPKYFLHFEVVRKPNLEWQVAIPFLLEEWNGYP